MASNEQEIEAKFMVRNLPALQSRLEALGAQLESPRVYEINLRFDNERGELAQARQVLRLRRDHRAVMTFKGPARIGEEVSMRQEIEFEVSNFTAAQHLLEALGYHVVVRYEKYRTTYRLGETVVVLDEMPYGHFVEIEGENADEIRRLAEQLGLRWEARSTLSYLALFEEVRRTFGLPPSDLSFRALQGVSVQPDDMGLSYADD